MTHEKEKFETYLQKYSYDCGAGAVAVVLKNFGYRVNYANILSALKVNKRAGTRARNIEDYFMNRGFPTFSKNAAFITDLIREREKGRWPIVAYQGSGTRHEMEKYEGGHYSVVAKVTKRNVYLLDPGISKDSGDGVGWQILPIPKFRERWIDTDKENGEELFYVRWMLSVGPKRKQ